MKLFNLLEAKADDMGKAIKAYLSKNLPNYNELYGNNTVFGQLVNVVTSITQNILLYIEDALTEQNKLTAQRKKSIYGLAIQSGYVPSLGKAATFNVRMTFIPNNTPDVSIIIPNRTRITCSQNGLIYNILLPQENILINTSDDATTRILQVVEGNFETQEYVSTGGKLYNIHIPFSGEMDMDYVEVLVNNEAWERCEGLYDMVSDGKQFTIGPNVTGGVDVMFGNDVHGRPLKAGDKVKVTYLLHDGEMGNLTTNEDTYFSFVDELEDIGGTGVNANEVFHISLANANEVGGGTYSEDASQVAAMIGYNSRSLVLADADNYKNLLNKFSFVGYNRTWSETGSMVVNSLVMRNYRQTLKEGGDYFSLKESDILLTEDQRNSIKNCVANSGCQLAGMTYEIYDPTIRKYALYLYLHMSGTSYDRSMVRNRIRNLIGEFFSNEANDMFIPKSDIIHLIKNNVDGVDGVDAYFLSERNETAQIKGYYIDRKRTYNPTTGTYDITDEKVQVEPGTDPGLGLDNHGNIRLDGDDEYPVLMGGWSFVSSETINEVQETTITDPIIIVFE